jgi:hypothetical protein
MVPLEKWQAVLMAVGFIAMGTSAEISVNQIFSDGMVIQVRPPPWP